MPFEDELRRLARTDPDFKDGSAERVRREFEGKVVEQARRSTLKAFERQLGGSEVERWVKSIAHAYDTHISTKRIGVVELIGDQAGWNFVVPVYYSFIVPSLGSNLIRLRVLMKSMISPSQVSELEYSFLFQPPERRINFDPRTDKKHVEVAATEFTNVARTAEIVKCLGVKKYGESKSSLDAADLCGGVNYEVGS